MKKNILTIVLGLFTTLIFAQDKGTFDFTASLHNQWYWRGYAVGPDPIMAAQASFKYKGFEIGIELVAKARRHRRPVAEVPTIWLDRSFGVSNFKIATWLPRYLKWYCYAFGPKKAMSK